MLAVFLYLGHDPNMPPRPGTTVASVWLNIGAIEVDPAPGMPLCIRTDTDAEMADARLAVTKILGEGNGNELIMYNADGTPMHLEGPLSQELLQQVTEAINQQLKGILKILTKRPSELEKMGIQTGPVQ